MVVRAGESGWKSGCSYDRSERGGEGDIKTEVQRTLIHRT